MTNHTLGHSYDDFPRIEEEFAAALDQSLHPRGPALLYDIASQLGLAPNANVLDLGCGEGGQAIALADRFGFMIVGVDPVPRHIELAEEALREAAKRAPALAGQVRFLSGAAELLPLEDSSVDLIWCREVVYLVADLDSMFAECRRVLRSGGRMLIYNQFVTGQMEPEAGWYTSQGIVAASARGASVEAALVRQGLRIEQVVDLGGEFGEYAQETRGEPGRRLLHTARLLRDPNRYIARFGRANYDLMLNDCLWHVYRMIGVLTGRIYLLTRT